MNKELKPQPTVAPTTARGYYSAISNPDPYQGESAEDFQERKQLFETLNLELVRQGITIDDLAAAEAGIVKPTGSSPLVNALIGRL